MKTLVFIPTYSWKVHAKLLKHVQQRDCKIVTATRTIIDKARNIALEFTVKDNYDYLLFLDDDVIPSVWRIEQLTSHKKDMVTGLYRLRQEWNPLAAYNITGEWLGDFTPLEEPPKELTKIDAAWAGLVAISNKVCKFMLDNYHTPFEMWNKEYYKSESWELVEFCFKNLIKHRPKLPHELRHRRIWEDMLFFRRAKFHWFQLWVDPKVTGDHIQEFYTLSV